jgi:protein-disulfide isomerase
MADKVHDKSSDKKENIAALVIFGIIVLAVVGLFTNWFGLTANNEIATSERLEVPYENDPVRGNLSAPVTIVVFSDFECPFCKVGEQTLMSVYQKYNGNVAVIFKNFPLTTIHPNAYNSALAAECANEQGKFWEYHDYLFSHNNALSPLELKNYAGDLALDTARFNECFDKQRYAFNVQRDMDVGRQLGISGTPAFFINGRRLSGAQPEIEFTKIIDEELASQS